MQTLRNRPSLRRGRVIYLKPDELAPNPVQPRKRFDEESLSELCESIKSYGILNPLTVRARNGGYELVAGERRLRAAKLAGLTEVPCILLDIDIQDSNLIALIENLQRRDLDFIEEAAGLYQLIRIFGLSQEEAARRIGKSQSAVANKLRLLKLPEDILEALRENGLTERHGRALLRLSTPQKQRAALEYILENDLTVAATDAYVDALLQSPAPEPEEEKEQAQPKRSFILKDVRVFLNTLSRSLDMMKQGGIDAGMRREETEDSLILTISIPKNKNAANVT
ncbi:MAG: ParB/RepB/Spo0J family partition protein [Eubacteriales bacterium]|nr:ParB/RepB/Spo0J family partition protein [Eubacteriales bacterium]